MKTINGHSYSKSEFPEYKTRVKINIVDKKDEDHNIDIYTTKKYNTHCSECKATFKYQFLSDVKSDIKMELVKYVEVIHVSTREQDDAATKMLFEMFEEEEVELTIEELVIRINGENLLLLKNGEDCSQYHLERLYAWQEDYNHIPWDEFKNYTYCDNCKGYDCEPCICYTR